MCRMLRDARIAVTQVISKHNQTVCYLYCVALSIGGYLVRVEFCILNTLHGAAPAFFASADQPHRHEHHEPFIFVAKIE